MERRDDARVHLPVMVAPVLRWLAPAPGSLILDLTVGAGGHASSILAATSNGMVLGLDRDPQILEVAARRLRAFGDRAALEHAPSDRVAEVCARRGITRIDGALMDLGVSSLQLDDAQRGFSFDRDGPLDMRMDARAKRSAADLLNRGSREDLLDAIGTLGEEPRARRVVDAILQARAQAPLRRTCELADLVARVLGGRALHHHPATRTFLGLRMAVNDELGVLERTIPCVIDLLRAGGRAVILAFHGGEDRVVKHALKAQADAGRVRVLTRKPELPATSEIEANPRARSARLRAAERLRVTD